VNDFVPSEEDERPNVSALPRASGSVAPLMAFVPTPAKIVTKEAKYTEVQANVANGSQTSGSQSPSISEKIAAQEEESLRNMPSPPLPPTRMHIDRPASVNRESARPVSVPPPSRAATPKKPASISKPVSAVKAASRSKTVDTSKKPSSIAKSREKATPAESELSDLADSEEQEEEQEFIVKPIKKTTKVVKSSLFNEFAYADSVEIS